MLSTVLLKPVLEIHLLDCDPLFTGQLSRRDTDYIFRVGPATPRLVLLEYADFRIDGYEKVYY